MNKPKTGAKTALFWIVLIVVFVVVLLVSNSRNNEPFKQFAIFQRDVDQGRVYKIQVENNRIAVALLDGQRYYTLGVVDDDLTERLSEQNVLIKRGKESSGWYLFSYLGITILLVLAVLFFLRRRIGSGGTANFLSLAKSRARPIPDGSKVTFTDVGGCEEAKEQLGDVVDYLKNPTRWEQANVRLPRGILLEGPPGCGKTLLARAVAGETNAAFYLSAASEFVEMFVGVGAARVRDTFEMAQQNAPAIIFIDELDAVGRRRGSGIGSSHNEREQTLNQLLLCLDGMENHRPVVVIAATNRPDILDTALLRPGRFDRRVRIPVLSREGRVQTLRIHAEGKPLDPAVSLETLANRTDGFTGAQLETLVNEAALLAVRRARAADNQRIEVTMADFERALRPSGGVSPIFNTVDALLIESTTQLAEPIGKAVVRVSLDGHAIEGELVWADAHFLKIRSPQGEVVVPKAQVERIEPLEGTVAANPLDVQPDPWASRNPGLA
ncbi:MAG: AAA family ATPase [Pirellulales bacterium]|nr:AAA family ATPase [Pirellulales bacterium]